MIRRQNEFFDSELLARLSKMEITARRVVDGFLAGKNKSSRQGFSVEFVEHREYSPGDDLRHLDWKVLGRLDRYYIKRYEEETNITGVLVVDCSASMTYASGEVSKFEVAAATASALGYMLNRQRDSVGLALFDSELRAYVPPSVRVTSLANIVSKMEAAEPSGKTSLEATLKRVATDLPRRSMFVILSDFFVPQQDVEAALRFLYYRGHEAIVLHVLDPAERSFPFESNTLFRGLEDNRQLITEPHRLRARYLEILNRFIDGVRKTTQECAFDYQLLDSPDELSSALTALLARRARKQRIVRRERGG